MIAEKLKSLERCLVNKNFVKKSFMQDWEFRSSGLPICALKLLYQHLVDGGKVERKETLSYEYYTKIGTLIHSLFQDYLGRMGQLWGNWENHKKEVIQHSFYPNIGEDCEYKELIVKDPISGLTGHVDGLLPLDENESEFLLIDFKTSSIEKLKKLKDSPKNYYYQLHVYWSLLEKYGPFFNGEFQKPLKIKGACLYFISRDNPFKDAKAIVYTTNDTSCLEYTNANYFLYQDFLKCKNRTEESIEIIKKIILSRLGKTDRELKDCGDCKFKTLGCVGLDKKIIFKCIKEFFYDQYGTSADATSSM